MSTHYLHYSLADKSQKKQSQIMLNLARRKKQALYVNKFTDQRQGANNGVALASKSFFDYEVLFFS